MIKPKSFVKIAIKEIQEKIDQFLAKENPSLNQSIHSHSKGGIRNINFPGMVMSIIPSVISNMVKLII